MEQRILSSDYAAAGRLTITCDTKVSDAELVMSPPVELHSTMQLHQWLHDIAKAHTERLVRSRSGDTVQVVTFDRPVPLLRMLASLPFVAKVTTEPIERNGRWRFRKTAGVVQSANRFRLALKR